MYWPSRAYESLNGYTGNGSFWRYNIGAADACEGCEMPRTTTNARPRPVPNGDQRVVLVVVGGLSAEPECADDPPRPHSRPTLPATAHRPRTAHTAPHPSCAHQVRRLCLLPQDDRRLVT